ncbi:MAG TPA: hypothetical protein V6D16_11845 [Candidatus Obscuribacterales bacterium]
MMKGTEGTSYAIVTKELRVHKPAISLEQIELQIKQFLIWASNNPDKE